jgi:hypothetical protein
MTKNLNSLTDRAFTNVARFEAVPAEELMFVTGGGVWGWIKKAAVWVKDNVFVDPAKKVIGIKGKF